MTVTSVMAKARNGIRYRSRLWALELLGPARLDDERDPVVRLKQEFGRPLWSRTQPRGPGHGPECLRLTAAAVAWRSDTESG